MEVLKRKHARWMTVLLIAALLFAVLPWVMYDLVEAGSLLWGFLGVGGATVCTVAMLAVRTVFLRCPQCGKGLARPYWNPGAGHEQFCTKCGQPFVFDDELDGSDTANE